MFYTILLSLYKTNAIGQAVEFIGGTNYVNLSRDPTFWEITWRTIIWTILAVFFKTVVGLGIALLLDIKFRGRTIARALIIIPWACSLPISAMIWRWTFNGEFGLLNKTLKMIGLMKNPPIWLSKPYPAFFANLYVDIWNGLPFMALVFLAGLQAISREYYEAAEIDGAGSIQKFFHITIPLLKPVIMVATLLSVLWTFNDFDVVYIITKGGPMNTTDILVTYLYKTGFKFLNFGEASTMAVITFAILLAFSFVYVRTYTKRGV